MYKPIAGVVVAVCLVGAASQARAQLVEGLAYGTILTEYYDRAYVAPPQAPARHVYFSGEQIYVRTSIGNPGSVPRPLDLGHRPFDQALEVTVVKAPEGAGTVVLRRVGAGEFIEGGRVTAAEWRGDFELLPRGEVRVFSTVTTRGAMPPGVYELRIVPRDRPKDVEIISDVICFEVRPLTTFAERAEVVRRRMESAELYQQDASRDDLRTSRWSCTRRVPLRTT